MSRRRLLLALGIGAAVVGGGIASAQTDEGSQTITVQVDAVRTITLDTEAPVTPSLRPTDIQTFAGGSVSFTTENPVAGGDEIVVTRVDDLANPSATAVTLAVLATVGACDCSDPGSAVDGDLDTAGTQPVQITTEGYNTVITGISDTSTYTASAALTYTVVSTSAPPGSYTFTVTYLIRGI